MIAASADLVIQKKLSYGMVGGGPGSFIGDVHRRAIMLDGLAEIKAGCFSSHFEKTEAAGAALEIDGSRLYHDYNEMAEKEAARPDKIDFVVIVTPNAAHYPAAKAFLEQGINVVCDKPVTVTLEEALELEALAKKRGLSFGVTYTYTGYAAIKEARERIKNGEIGEIRFVNGEYPQDWLATAVEKAGNKQAAWRTNPALAGKTCCTGDIGSHLENMIAYVTGLRIKSLCARLDTMVAGRALDDNATIMVNYEGGAKGVYWASQIAWGYGSALRFRVFGSKGMIEWFQENPNILHVTRQGEATAAVACANFTSPLAKSYFRIPSGHPEGYIEAMGNFYRSYIGALRKKAAGESLSGMDLDYPRIEMGADSIRFIDKCVESSQQGSVWVAME
jgi:predicted dehydrogenase